MATKATVTLSDMPKSQNKNKSFMEDTIVKILDLQEKINADICILLDLKRNISKVIEEIEDVEQKLILEKRYLCFETWEQIAVELNYNIRQIYRIHSRALNSIKI